MYRLKVAVVATGTSDLQNAVALYILAIYSTIKTDLIQ